MRGWYFVEHNHPWWFKLIAWIFCLRIERYELFGRDIGNTEASDRDFVMLHPGYPVHILETLKADFLEVKLNRIDWDNIIGVIKLSQHKRILLNINFLYINDYGMDSFVSNPLWHQLQKSVESIHIQDAFLNSSYGLEAQLLSSVRSYVDWSVGPESYLMGVHCLGKRLKVRGNVIHCVGVTHGVDGPITLVNEFIANARTSCFETVDIDVIWGKTFPPAFINRATRRAYKHGYEVKYETCSNSCRIRARRHINTKLQPSFELNDTDFYFP